MSKHVNKAVIGAFVVGAIALFIAGLLLLGSGSFLTRSPQLVLYFSGSVMGLRVGSPVVFRGVPVGFVKDINIYWDKKAMDFSIPVIIEMTSKNILSKSKTKAENNQEVLQQLIDKGLRGQLGLQSFVTGQLLIQLDFFPGTPARLHSQGAIPQIPTVPSSFEELSHTLQKLPIDRIANQLLKAIEGINKLIYSPSLNDSLTSFGTTLHEMNTLLRSIDNQVEPLATSARKTIEAYHQLATRLDASIPSTMGQVDSTLQEIATASAQARNTLQSMEALLSNNSATIVDFQNALQELARTARAFRVFADYLEQHPNSLLIGKENPQ